MLPLAEIQAQSRKLYQLLLKPVESSLQTSRLVIVPDGVLAYLPFETLYNPAASEKLSRAQYLIERFAISYAPSATALAAIRAARKQADKPQGMLLAFGDPVYREDRRTAGRIASPNTKSAPAASPVASTRERGLDLENLPYTRAEVAGILGVYRGDRCKAYLGSDAREEAIRTENLDAYRYIHFATHGAVNEERPSRSGIVLSLDDKSKEDGVLQVSEIMRLKLNAEMVTISACSTGLGKLVDGEGLLGLSRAFFYAGSSSVVASLWNVNDASTAVLMESFYRGLNRGLSKDAALRGAKLSLMKSSQPAWQHPYFWAGFVIAGDAR